MAKQTASQKVEMIIDAAAGTEAYTTLRAQREFFNSDSAFLSWHQKTGSSRSVIQAARLLQRTWKALGLARTFAITLRAIKAALMKLATAGVKITQKIAVAVFEELTGKKPSLIEKKALVKEVRQLAFSI